MSFVFFSCSGSDGFLFILLFCCKQLCIVGKFCLCVLPIVFQFYEVLLSFATCYIFVCSLHCSCPVWCSVFFFCFACGLRAVVGIF